MSEKMPTAEQIRKEHAKMLSYNNSVQLDETVKANENFFVGKQWEGVQANGLPTPVFNFLKRVTLFSVASITTDNVKMQASPLEADALAPDVQRAADVVNREFERLFEFNKVCGLMREYMRNAAVDGDGCTYTYWDPELDMGHGLRGGIVTEIVENTRVGFGNTACRDVQRQPYILIEMREMTEELRRRARDAGCRRWEDIVSDTEQHNVDSYQQSDDKTTVVLRMWKNRDSGTVWACESAGNVMVRKPWDTGLHRYPVTWINWDYVQNSYHGMAMITGLIPNQIFINKLFAMSMISLMTTAYPKIVYDKTRLPKWDNRVGAAIGINGGDVNSVAKIIDPAQISPQIAEFIKLAVDYTQTFLGATNAALGDTRPDNTSAIIALQRAASIPSELTKQNLYQSVEDLGRIYLDFMGANYGVRKVKVDQPEDLDPNLVLFAGMTPGKPMVLDFDFGTLQDMPMTLKIDVGASSYWSEIASMQTLDNLLMQDKITVDEYLERVPDGYIPKRQELILAKRQAAQMQGAPSGAADTPDGGLLVDSGAQTPVPVGGGYGALQRKINETGEVT